MCGPKAWLCGKVELQTVKQHPRQVRRGLLAVVLGLLVGIAGGCGNVMVPVGNDTGAYVRVADCVDDSADVEPNETFDANGIPSNDELVCLVTRSHGFEQCVAIPHVHTIHGTFPLSHAIETPMTRC